jgi:S1-C subfamily serine protease
VLARSALAVLLVGCSGASARDARTERWIASALVKVYVTSNPYDYQSPWQRSGIETSSGSGVIIEGRRILTAAHVVADHVAVEVKRAGATRRFNATVAFIGHACDLAVLQVADPAFFAGARALALGELVKLRDRVHVYGFPEGGDLVAVTGGIVSRVETGAYGHSDEPLLLAQIDAAINAGNSGGPVVAGTQVVGIAAETLTDAENIGYMIPAPVIRHLLEDIGDGRFDGFPRLGIETQPLENQTHRTYLGIAKQDSGVLVKRVNYGSSAWGLIQAGDVLLSIDGVDVSRDQTVPLRGTDRVHYGHLIASHQVGSTAQLSVLRQGSSLVLDAKLTPLNRLVPGPRYGVPPTYLIYGGLVFQPLSANYLELYGGWPADLVNHAEYQNVVTRERQAIIVMTQVLSHPSNQGYDELHGYVVTAVNGQMPRDMCHLAERLAAAGDGWVNIQFEGGQVIVLNGKTVREAHPAILQAYGISRARSDDLQP